MYLDIFICLFILLSAFLGWRKGFMRNILGFIASIISLVIAIFASKPLAGLLDKWFNFSEHLSKLIKGQGSFLNFLICIIVIYTIVYLIFFFINRAIRKAKEEHKTLDKADKIAGIFLGIAKGFLSICMMLLTLYFLSVIPFMGKVVDWLLNKGVIGKFMYETTAKLIAPIFGALEAFIKNHL